MSAERQVTHFVGDDCPGSHEIDQDEFEQAVTCQHDTGVCETCGHAYDQHGAVDGCLGCVDLLLAKKPHEGPHPYQPRLCGHDAR